MKTTILLLVAIFSLAACQKEAAIQPKIVSVKEPVVAEVKSDSIPDKAIFRIKLAEDSINSDETIFVFNKKSKLSYDANLDADYFPGNGPESLASVTNDGKDLAIYYLPYKQGMAVGLDVKAKKDGAFSLQISYESKIPANIQIWVKDMYLKDSVNIRTTNYNFKVAIADTSSFGNKRFKLVIK